MNKDYEKLFGYINKPEPAEQLFDKIISQIQKEKKMAAARKRIVLFSTSTLLSVGLLVPVLSATYSAFSQSGLIQISSLIFSDSAIIAGIWKQFLLSLLEALPTANIILSLIVFLVFTESAKRLSRNLSFNNGLLRIKIITA